MSGLHPSARSLIESAKRREATLPEEVRGRVHRSVLRRATALAAAVATTTSTTVAAKASALVGALATPLVVSATLSGLAGVAFLVATAVSRPPTAARPAPPPTTTEQLARRSAAPSHLLLPEHATVPFPPEPTAPELGPPSGGTYLHAPSAPQSVPVVAPAPAKTPAHDEPAVNAGRTPSRAGAPAYGTEGGSEPSPTEAPAGGGPDVTPRGATGSALPLADSRPNEAIANALASELDLLHRVHAALRSRQADRALTLLDCATTPGPLDEEVEAARVSALCQLGRDADARVVVDRLVAKWPGSPLATRLQGGCAGLGATAGDGRN